MLRLTVVVVSAAIIGISCSGPVNPPRPLPVATSPPPPAATATPEPAAPTAVATQSPGTSTPQPPTPTAAPLTYTPSPTPAALATQPPATPTPQPPTTAVDQHPDDIAALSEMSTAYWSAFNSYDADSVVAMYDDGYRQAREERVRSDIAAMRLFGVKLGVTENAPPVLTAPNVGELYVSVKNPLDVRKVHMIFHKLDGEWKIVHAEQVAK